MSRIGSVFSRKKPLIVYATACDPDCKSSVDLFKSILDFADVVEIGMPFSDPLADGPVIQKAHERALSAGATVEKVFDIVKELRNYNDQVPLILMGYYNPIFVYGEERFVEASVRCGVDGFIIPDLPPEEGEAFSDMAKKAGLSPVFLAAPTSTDDRLRKIGNVSGEFIYYVSVTGITGERDELDYTAVCRDMNRIRSITGKKVVVGFGISKKEHIINMLGCADGFVVGSAVVRKIGQGDYEGLRDLLRTLREAVEE